MKLLKSLDVNFSTTEHYYADFPETYRTIIAKREVLGEEPKIKSFYLLFPKHRFNFFVWQNHIGAYQLTKFTIGRITEKGRSYNFRFPNQGIISGICLGQGIVDIFIENLAQRAVDLFWNTKFTCTSFQYLDNWNRTVLDGNVETLEY